MKYFPLIPVTLVLFFFACAESSQSDGSVVRSAFAEFDMPGSLINSETRMRMSHLYDTAGILESTTTEAIGGPLLLKIETEFDAEGRETVLRVFRDNALNIYQETDYTQDGHLLREFRLEYQSKDIADTIDYTYLYQPGSDTSYRLNNQDTVTRFIETKEGNVTVRTEEAYPIGRVEFVREERKTVNDSGKPTQILSTTFYKDTERAPADTIVSQNDLVYDAEGRLIEESVLEDGQIAGRKKYVYVQNGIKRMEYTSPDRNYTVNYTHTWWD